MARWWVLASRIGAFGFFKEFRPEDPYITQYLVGPRVNLTEEQVNHEVFPIATYTGLILAVFVFLVTDIVCYKPMIVLEALSGIIVQVILIWWRELFGIQVMEVVYALMIACDVAYYTYIYTLVDRQHFLKVTYIMKAASLSGRCVSAVVSQTVLLEDLLTISDLNHLTLIGMSVALLCAISLPATKRSLYCHRDPAVQDEPQLSEVPTPSSSLNEDVDNEIFKQDGEKRGCSLCLEKCKTALGLLWSDFLAGYSNWYLLRLSVWVAFATCGYNQIMTYSQVLWLSIGGNELLVYNGAIEAVYTICSAVAAILFGMIDTDWSRYGELLIGILTVVEGVVLLLAASTYSIPIAYIVYIIFGMLYNIMLVMVNSEIAKHLKEECYALIFGVNTFVSLILQTVLTWAVTGPWGNTMSIRAQFNVYGICFVILGAVYAVKSLVTVLCRTRRQQ